MANILITGGSRGIGAANVRRLAREGHRVCFIYKESIETAHSLTRVLQAEGCDVIGVQCDVRQPSQVQKVVDTMNNNWGGVDVLINGAGISWTGLLQDMLDAEWLDLFDTNVNGTFYCTRAVLPHMLAQQKGVIINISSIWGSHPGSCEVAYSGIRVNAIAPGVVHTDMVEKLGEETNAVLHADMPMHRYANPEEIAGLISYLISDEASYITGQVITIAGGFVI